LSEPDLSYAALPLCCTAVALARGALMAVVL
jgi:hypothetical protein